MSVFRKQANTNAVIIELIKMYKPSVAADDIVSELDIHPDYPSLLALNDIANNFGVKSSAYKLKPDELSLVPCPFIAHTSRPGKEYLIINRWSDDELLITDDKHRNKTIATVNFLAIFDGIVLVPDEDNIKVASQVRYSYVTQYRSALVFAGLAVAVICLLGLNDFIFSAWQISLLVLVKLIGVGVAVLLLIQSIDKNNPVVQTLCGGAGKANCNAILSSNAAQVFSWLSWSEVGFFYFLGTCLALFLGGAGVLATLAILNIICLPYTIYSVYYQARVARQWCVFCLLVQFLIWLEFIPLHYFLKGPLHLPGFNDWMALIFSFLLPIAGWALLKPVLLRAQQLKPLKNQLRSIKYNTTLFNAFLKEQPKYTTPAKNYSIVLGDAGANTIITMVSNPYCQPCGLAHADIEKWLAHNPEIQVRVVFTASNKDDDDQTAIARHLMALSLLPDKTLVTNALHDWYSQKQRDYKQWIKSYPAIVSSDAIALVDEQRKWCNLSEVKVTPTFLVNGYVLPQLYKITDIKYLIES